MAKVHKPICESCGDTEAPSSPQSSGNNSWGGKTPTTLSKSMSGKSSEPDCAAETCCDKKTEAKIPRKAAKPVVHETHNHYHSYKQESTKQCCNTGVAAVRTTKDPIPAPCGEIEHCPSEPTGPSCGVKTTQPFNMPGTGDQVTLAVEDSSCAVEGALLFNKQIGFLEVVSAPSEDTIIAKGVDCDFNELQGKQPGEPIDSCKKFVMGPPQCNSLASENTAIQSGRYLNCDFTIQAAPTCWPIKVTTVDGIATNDRISISGYEYKVSKVIDSLTLEICNEGEGGPVNTAVKADENEDGLLDHPIVRIEGSNPCALDMVDCGTLTGCANNEARRITGAANGSVFTLTDKDTGKGEYRYYPQLEEELSTPLSSCISLDPDNESGYLITVGSTNLFSDQECSPVLVKIGGKKFRVGSIESGTSMRVYPCFEVTEAGQLNGTCDDLTVALCPCCEQCNPSIEVDNNYDLMAAAGIGYIQSWAQNFDVPDGESYFSLPDGAIEIGDVASEASSGLFEECYVNESCCNQYVKLMGNVEQLLFLPDGVEAFYSFEVARTGIANTQSFLKKYAKGPTPLCPIANGTPTLISQSAALKVLNTTSDMLFDQVPNYVAPEEEVCYVGFMRFVFKNTTGSTATITSAGTYRFWFEALTACAPTA